MGMSSLCATEISVIVDTKKFATNFQRKKIKGTKGGNKYVKSDGHVESLRRTSLYADQ